MSAIISLTQIPLHSRLQFSDTGNEQNQSGVSFAFALFVEPQCGSAGLLLVGCRPSVSQCSPKTMVFQ